MKERIVLLRKELKMNQTDFAKSINLTQNFLSLVENGTRNISDRTVSDICRVYNVSESWLRTGTGEMFQPKDRNSEIADIVAEMFKSEDSDFRFQLTKMLYEMEPSEIAALKNIALKIAAAIKEDLPG